MTTEDSTRPVRAGEEINAADLSAWLKMATPKWEATGDALEITQFPGGFSNLTYLIKSGRRELVLRRPPAGARRGTAHDVAREFRTLLALYVAGVRVPQPIALCEDETILGAPFYLMERIRGVILRAKPTEGLVLDAPTMGRLSNEFVDTLVTIHAVPVDAPGIKELARGDGYVARQVNGWTKRYEAARTDNVPEMERLAAWLNAHPRPDSGSALIHNDYKYDNLVLDPDDISRIRGVLDWEMATVGDPLMDLGTTLAYWVQADDSPILQSLGLGITALPGNLTREGIADRYAARTGRVIERLDFYYAFGLFKVAVIAQQIYARYRAGHTTDERFAQLGEAVKALSVAGVTAIR